MIDNTRQGQQVTAAMLAKHAGVSRVAVYAAFNPGKKTTVGISEKTKNKILAAAEELGYIPNDLARTLVSGRSRNIGLLLQSNRSAMSQQLIAACSRLFVDNGYLVISESSDEDEKREREILNRFLIRRVDCVVISWVDEESNADLRKQFGRCGIPIINIRNREPDFDYSAAISFDEGQVMRQICGLLARCGLRKLCYAGTIRAAGAIPTSKAPSGSTPAWSSPEKSASPPLKSVAPTCGLCATRRSVRRRSSATTTASPNWSRSNCGWPESGSRRRSP